MLKYISLIIFYLLVVSSFFALAIYEETSEEIATIDNTLYSGSQVDLSGDFDLSTICDEDSGSFEEWEIIDNTLVYNGVYLGEAENPILFRGIQKNNAGYYEVEYTINNSENLAFDIYIAKGGLTDSNTITLEYTSDGVIKTDYPYTRSSVGYFFKKNAYTGSANLSGIHTIKTVLNPLDLYVSVYIDESEVYTIPMDIKEAYDNYGGIKVKDDGHFEITEIKTYVVLSSYDDSSFISIISALLVWNVSEDYFPATANILLIKFPMIILAIAIAFYVRGVN